MDLLGTKWRIVEYRASPLTSNLSTKFRVEHKILNIFWCRAVAEREYDAYGDFSFYYDYDTLEKAIFALVEKIGKTKFEKIQNTDRLEIKQLPPIEFKTVIYEVSDANGKNYYIYEGFFESKTIFVKTKTVYGPSNSIKELIMKCNVSGKTISNINDIVEKTESNSEFVRRSFFIF